MPKTRVVKQHPSKSAVAERLRQASLATAATGKPSVTPSDEKPPRTATTESHGVQNPSA